MCNVCPFSQFCYRNVLYSQHLYNVKYLQLISMGSHHCHKHTAARLVFPQALILWCSTSGREEGNFGDFLHFIVTDIAQEVRTDVISISVADCFYDSKIESAHCSVRRPGTFFWPNLQNFKCNLFSFVVFVIILTIEASFVSPSAGWTRHPPDLPGTSGNRYIWFAFVVNSWI